MAWSRRRSVAVGAIAGLLIGTLAAVLIVRSGGDGPVATLTQPGAGTEPGLPTAKDVSGARLPDATFDLLNGDGTVRLADYRGTPLVVNVWASWCPPCQQEMPAFEAVH